MKTHLLLAILALGSLTSCDKAGKVVTEINKKATELAEASKAAKSSSSSSGEWVSNVSLGDYDSFTQQPGKVVIVDFYADWCSPCKKLAPILDRAASLHGGSVLIGKIDVDKNTELAANEGVSSIPDVRIFLNGREVDRFVGLPSEDEVMQRIEKHTKKIKVIELVAPEAAAPADEVPTTPQPAISPASKEWLPPGMQRR